MRTSCLLALGLAVATGSAACASPKTSVTQTWSAEATPSEPIGSVLVFAASMDETNRRSFEDAFASRLAQEGVSARRSYQLYPNGLPDRDAARAAARRANVDAVLVVRSRGAEDAQGPVPGSYGGDFWGGYYGSPSGLAYTPGYATTTEIAKLELTLWDARSDDEGRLVWSATTRTSEASKGASLTKSVTEKVVPELSRQGFLPRRAQ
jgi:hypothetical protein